MLFRSAVFTLELDKALDADFDLSRVVDLRLFSGTKELNAENGDYADISQAVVSWIDPGSGETLTGSPDAQGKFELAAGVTTFSIAVPTRTDGNNNRYEGPETFELQADFGFTRPNGQGQGLLQTSAQATINDLADLPTVSIKEIGRAHV